MDLCNCDDEEFPALLGGVLQSNLFRTLVDPSGFTDLDFVAFQYPNDLSLVLPLLSLRPVGIPVAQALSPAFNSVKMLIVHVAKLEPLCRMLRIDERHEQVVKAPWSLVSHSDDGLVVSQELDHGVLEVVRRVLSVSETLLWLQASYGSNVLLFLRLDHVRGSKPTQNAWSLRLRGTCLLPWQLYIHMSDAKQW